AYALAGTGYRPASGQARPHGQGRARPLATHRTGREPATGAHRRSARSVAGIAASAQARPDCNARRGAWLRIEAATAGRTPGRRPSTGHTANALTARYRCALWPDC